jgi:hypothetical protein
MSAPTPTTMPYAETTPSRHCLSRGRIDGVEAIT